MDWRERAEAGERAAETALRRLEAAGEATPLAAALTEAMGQDDAFVAGFAQHLAERMLAALAMARPAGQGRAAQGSIAAAMAASL